MLKLNEEQRKVLVQAFPAAANLGLGALLFGQFLRDAPYSLSLGIAGIVVWIAGVVIAIVFAGGKAWIQP